METTVFTKKIKLYPLGDKTEIDRVYTYLRDAIYTQYLVLNRYMSQVGTLYYSCDRDISSVEWKEGYREIFLKDNPLISDITQPKGLGMYSTVSMKVKQDFSTALKNGLAKGERQLPYYKRDFPLMIAGRFLEFSSDEEDDKTIYKVKFVNKIGFKVILGSKGNRDSFLVETLEKLVASDEHYKICQSQISFDKKGSIILALTIKKEYDNKYIPKEGRVMGVSLGYDIPIMCAFSDSTKEYSIGNREEFIEKRIAMQQHYSQLQRSLKAKPGGHGRKAKLANLERYKAKEKNYAKNYNHLLSKQIVDLAEKNKAECIVIENITKDVLVEYPVLLRNWSFYQLIEFIKYKAKVLEIPVIIGEKTKTNLCHNCGEELSIENILTTDETEWSRIIECKCSNCKKKYNYAYNKAKLLAKNE